MKKIIVAIIALVFSLSISNIAYSQRAHRAKTVHVKAYHTKKGKTVKSHYRSKPRRHSFINYSSGNFAMYRRDMRQPMKEAI